MTLLTHVNASIVVLDTLPNNLNSGTLIFSNSAVIISVNVLFESIDLISIIGILENESLFT